jgi:hypothetical protein
VLLNLTILLVVLVENFWIQIKDKFCPKTLSINQVWNFVRKLFGRKWRCVRSAPDGSVGARSELEARVPALVVEAGAAGRAVGVDLAFVLALHRKWRSLRWARHQRIADLTCAAKRRKWRNRKRNRESTYVCICEVSAKPPFLKTAFRLLYD